MMQSKRKYYRHYSIGMVVASVVALVGTLVANRLLLHISIVDKACIYGITAIIGAYVLAYLFIIIKNGGIKKYIEYSSIQKEIEDSLIAIGAYNKHDGKVYADTPKIRIKNGEIRIMLNNLKFRETIESHMASFSTALPERYIVDDYYLTPNEAELIIKYEDQKSYKPEKYTLNEYKKLVNSMGNFDIYVDKKHIINLNTYPHWLISGQSGSGKSYLVQEMLIQAIYKGFDVTVLDLKRSYGLYRQHIKYAYEPKEIVSTLQDLETEMKDRLKALQPELDKTPNVLAVDVGYTPKLIIVEEYISLLSSLDKKDKEEVERIVRTISVLARQSSVHLIIVLQSAGTENIQATTRSNLTKVLMGRAQSNILTATFGTGVDIPNQGVQMQRGEGLIQLDRITVLRVPEIKDIDSFR